MQLWLSSAIRCPYVDYRQHIFYLLNTMYQFQFDERLKYMTICVYVYGVHMARVVQKFFDSFSSRILKSPDDFDTKNKNPIENCDCIGIDTNPAQEQICVLISSNQRVLTSSKCALDFELRLNFRSMLHACCQLLPVSLEMRV